MKPYYDEGGMTIYHGDCRDVLWRLDLTDVAVVIADPPYGQTSLEWDRWPDAWVSHLGPARNLWCFGSMRMFMDRAREFQSWQIAQDVVWRKHNGSNFHADRFRRVHESIVQFYRGAWGDVWRNPVYTLDATKKVVRRKKRPTHTGHIEAGSYRSEDGGPRLQRSVLDVASCHGYAENETQKPEGIVRPLLDYSAPPRSLILDPFMGSGTTLRVAKDGGWRAIGIEVRESQCEVAALRCAQEVLDLGGA